MGTKRAINMSTQSNLLICHDGPTIIDLTRY